MHTITSRLLIGLMTSLEYLKNIKVCFTYYGLNLDIALTPFDIYLDISLVAVQYTYDIFPCSGI